MVIWFLIQSFNQRQSIVIIDDETVYLPKSLEFVEANDLHIAQAKLAVQALLNRDSVGVDNSSQLRRLYGHQAFEKAKALIKREGVEFEVKQLHQKVEIIDVNLLRLRSDSVKVLVSGNLIRAGRFEDENLIEVLEFKMNLLFQRNHNMAVNGRYPTVVTDFQIQSSPVSSQ